jgi:ribosomal protein S12 methylthiotransferase
MRRGTNSNKTIDLIRKFREQVPDMAIRTTFIVGYPGETEEQFEELKEFVANTRFERMGCFSYSHEENTHAYRLEDNVPQEVKERRVADLMELQGQISFDLNQEKIGHTYKCIFDRKEGNYFIGRTEFDSPDVDNNVIVDAGKHYVQIGQFVNIRIEEATDFDLYGSPV